MQRQWNTSCWLSEISLNKQFSSISKLFMTNLQHNMSSVLKLRLCGVIASFFFFFLLFSFFFSFSSSFFFFYSFVASSGGGLHRPDSELFPDFNSSYTLMEFLVINRLNPDIYIDVISKSILYTK